MKIKWLSVLVVCILAISLVAVACATPTTPKPASTPSPTPSGGPKEILIGTVASMTGAFAGFGEGCTFGYKAAIEDINKQGGVNVKEYGTKIPMRLIVTDSESNPQKVGSLAEDLILRDKVQFLVSPDSPCEMHIPISYLADQYKVPHIVSGGPLEPWLSVRGTVDPPWPYTWFTGFALAIPAAEGDFRYNKKGYTSGDQWLGFLDKTGNQTNKKAAVFASDDPDGIGWYAAIPSALESWGLDVLGADRKLGLFPMGTTDFMPMIKEWKNYGCDILWGNCPGPDFGAMWRQCQTQGFQPKICIAVRAHLFYIDANSWGGDLPLGVAGDTWWSPNFKDSPGIGGTTPMSLFERWREETGQPLNPAIGHGYPTIQVLVDAIERAGTLNPEAINKAIGETDLKTVTNRVKFTETEHFSRLPLLFGQWQKVDKPWKWECPVVISYHDFCPVEAEIIFPIPYK